MHLKSGWKRAAGLLAGLALCLAGASGSAWSQALPANTLRIISPYAAGGGNDVICRAVAARLGAILGQTVIVENRAGANTVLAAGYVAKLSPDDNTIMLVPTQHVYNPAIYDNVRYDPIKDFTPITMVGSAPLLMVAGDGAPFKNLQELVQYARKRPAKELTFSSAGVGSSGHLAGALLEQVTGLKFQHVAYRGTAPAAQAVLSHEVMLSIAPPATLLPFVRSGKMIAIGMTGDKRSLAAPDIPTIMEQGLAGYDASLWYGFVGPARMRPEVVARLNKAIATVVNDKDMRKLLSMQGVDASISTPDEFAKVLSRDFKRWGPIVKAAGVKSE